MKLQKVKEEPEIPTASMADIAFLLIVFFMLTTVISATKGIDHMLPQDNNDQEQTETEKSIYIKIEADNMFSIDKKEPMPISSTDKIIDYVYNKVSKNYKKPIIIHTDPEAKYESMIAVFDAVKQVEARLHEEWRQEGKVKLPDLTISIPTLAEAADWGLQ
jgi:biopolymer transport protein ExbD